MPNSMTNMEINDVLSSIRRLVSGDKHEVQKGAVPKDDFFVLTPAHRIETGSSEEAGLPDLTLPSEVVAAPTDISEAPLELVNPAFPETDTEFTENVKDEHLAPEAEPLRMTLVPEADMLEIGETQTLEDRIAELEEAVSRSDDEWEPDGSEPDTVQLPTRHLFEIVGGVESPDTAVADDFDEVQAVAPEFSHAENVVDDTKPEPERPLQLAEVATFSHIPNPPSQPAVSEVPQSEVVKSEIAEVLEGNDDIFVDEDLLRRVVSDIVREELQGKLGERITRNLRRMVRREIEQTLSLKDFD